MTNKKEEQGLPLSAIIIAAIVLIVLVVLWVVFTGIHQFNPETDVCEEWESECFVYFMDGICASLEEESNCIKWRPKTLCEKDPNNEECECEEWKCGQRYSEFCEYEWTTIGSCLPVPCGNTRAIPIDEYKKKIFKTCIKAHQKTISDLSCDDLLSCWYNDMTWCWKISGNNDRFLLEYLERCGGKNGSD